MLPGPKVYDPDKNMDRVMNRSDHLLGVMLKGRMITDDQYLVALMEIPFAGEPSDLVDTEQDPGSATDIPPEIEEESITNEDQVTVTSEEGVESGEVFTTQDGIVEIPIEKSKVKGER